MALCFALGSSCFLIGPFPGYASLVGDAADAVTFFIGSILFTAGGALQSSLAYPHRHAPGAGRPAWWAPHSRRRCMVGAGDQPAGLHLLRHLGGRGLRCSQQWLRDRPGRGELEHLARRGLLPGVRAGHAADRPHAEVAAPATAARARAWRAADARCRRVAYGDGPRAEHRPSTRRSPAADTRSAEDSKQGRRR
jgi:hypothetical protein